MSSIGDQPIAAEERSQYRAKEQAPGDQQSSLAHAACRAHLPERPYVVSFAWDGRRVIAHGSRAPCPTLTYECRLADMPFSIEDPNRRDDLIRAIQWAKEGRYPGTVKLSDNQRVVLADTIDLPAEPLTLSGFVTHVVLAALQSAPLADRIEGKVLAK